MALEGWGPRREPLRKGKCFHIGCDEDAEVQVYISANKKQTGRSRGIVLKSKTHSFCNRHAHDVFKAIEEAFNRRA